MITQRSIKGFRLMLLLLLSFTLIGCAGNSILEPDPRCPFVERGGCQSMKSINRMIDQNRYTPDGNYVQQPFSEKRYIHRQKEMRVYVPPGVDKFGNRYNGYEEVEVINEEIH